MNIRTMLAAACTLVLAACSVVTEVVPAGKDTYVVAGEDSVGETSGAIIKTTLYKKATSYCESIGKKFLPLNDSKSSYTADLRFRCLEEDDPEYRRPIMESVPNVRIENLNP
ncbi:hypothetical protein [Thiolapillus sp.]|uniref:hypothetical protein n=1 Tax=Thiolapillus sp. TaxID=2017437 RepID=UPI003AF7A962